MPRYVSATQVASFLSDGGWPDSELVTATAITLAESSGQVDADNGIAAGLMGINYHAHKEYDKDRLKSDPVYNTSAGWAIFQAQEPAGHWSHNKWETFPVAYKTYLPTARSGVASFHKLGTHGAMQTELTKVDPSSAYPKSGLDDKLAEGAGGLIDAAMAVPDFLGKLAGHIFDPAFWWRVLKIFIGLGLAATAVHIILQSTSIGRTVEGTAMKAAIA